jgi:hypothetical protein
MNNAYRAALAATLGLCLLACEEKKQAPLPTALPKPTGPSSKPSQPPTVSPAPTPAPTPTPSPATPPVNSAPAPSSGSVAAAGYTFPLAKGWTSVPTQGPMRIAEIAVPDPSGDAAKACSITFVSAGGDIQSNIDRWAGQVKGPDGQPSKPTIDKKTVAGLNVTIAEMTGAYAGMGETTAKPNTTLRAAIVETPQGMLFIKMTGPAEAVAAAKPGFDAMIDGMKKQ